MEEWRDVKGYEGLYQVSNYGKVRHMMFKNNIVEKKQIKLLKLYTNKQGRVYISLYKNGHRKNCIVHRLVAGAFLDNPQGLPEVNHIDGNPSNNFVKNLEWCTKKYNAQHAYYNNLTVLRARNESEKKTVIRSDGKIYESIRSCAREMGVTQRSINDALQGRRGVRRIKGYSFNYFEGASQK